MGGEAITLKWGNLKGWSGLGPAAIEAGQRFLDTTGVNAMEWLSSEQKELLCAMIDALGPDATITNDWTGEIMTKDDAKAYVREYGA